MSAEFGGIFEELFGDHNEPRRHSPYGFLTEREIEERQAAFEMKILARSECSLCDNDGYRPNGLVCDHVNRFKTHTLGMRKVRRALASKLQPVQDADKGSN